MSLLFAIGLQGLVAAKDPEPPALPVITVVARRAQNLGDTGLSVAGMSPADAEPLAAHANELLDAVPGAWISRGSGQEHLTAIRSPVLTGAGACGAFLLLEDDLPIRPVGLCNVNGLFELNLERAQRVEVLRGPGSALHGANALHGAIQAVMPSPGPRAAEGSLLWGEDDYRRIDAGAGGGAGGLAWGLDASLQSAGSFRVDEGYDQQKVNLSLDQELGEWTLRHRLAAINLNQETAGFILGFEAYRDPGLRRQNLNPEAFRDAHALRASSRIEFDRGAWTQRLTPFARSSRMRFRQHFLPGKPLEDNGQDSFGLQWLAHRRDGPFGIDLGLDLESADLSLVEFQEGPTPGSPFLQATRPAGFHYDFQVDQRQLALFGQIEWPFGEGWSISAGLRVETLRYDYDNRMLDGNTTDTGAVCGFGGCLYTRPADRQDRFTDLAPKLGLQWTGGDQLFWMRLARGFRPPQATELYRLQRGQSVADLDSETLDGVELGWRGRLGAGRGSVVGYVQEKRNVIFRDANGFNVADGRTRHRGLELDWRQPIGSRWSLGLNATLARHTYVDARSPSETIVPGNRVDTAPDRLARLSLDWQPSDDLAMRLEWVHQGRYFLDASNDHHYPGHDLLNLGFSQRLGGAWTLTGRLGNLFDERFAERADFAFGEYRYFPGDGRRLTLGLSYRP